VKNDADEYLYRSARDHHICTKEHEHPITQSGKECSGNIPTAD